MTDAERKNPLVSIVLPSLNSVTYIKECLDSIVNQTVRPFELLCVDAESEDGTLNILEQYETNYDWIHVITTNVRSYGYQVNLGIKQAKGKYLMIVESDDILSRDACEIMSDSIIRYRADFVRGTMMDFVNYNDKKVAYVSSYYYANHETDRLIRLNEEPGYRRTNTICIQASIYDLDFIKKHKIDLHESRGASYQDAGFCIQVSSFASSCTFLNKVIYYRRRGNEGSSYFVGANYEKIIDEYKWIAGKLLIDSNETSKNNLLLYTKLHSYYWMLARVSKEVQVDFIQSIQKELDDYDTFWCEKNLNDTEKKMLSELRGGTIFSGMIEKKYSNLKRILEWLDYGSIVIFGMGNLGRFFTENLIDVQKSFDKNVIDAVCDNNDALIGTEMYGKTIHSVETTTNSFPKSMYFVVNKREPEEMKKQLVCAGISEGQIYIINSKDQISEMFDLEMVAI